MGESHEAVHVLGMQVAALASLGTHDELLRDGQLGEDRITHVPGLRENGEKRMRRIAFALGLAALLAGPAMATTFKYVAQTATGDGSGSSTSNYRSLSNANADTTTDVAYLLAAGTYTTAIAPARSGASTRRIYYVGDILNSDARVFSAAIGSSGTLSRSFVTIKGVRLNAPTITASITGTYDSLVHCSVNLYTLQIGLEATLSGANYNTIAFCRGSIVGQGFAISGKSYGVSNPSESLSVAQYNIVDGCDFTINHTSTSTRPAFYSRSARYTTYRNSTFKCTIANGSADGLWKMYYTKYCTFTDCRFEFTPNATSGNEYALGYFRDGSAHNRFVRDTVIIHSGASNYAAQIYLTASGAVIPPNTSAGNDCEYNSYNRCLFINEQANASAMVWQNGVLGDTIINTVAISDSGTAFSIQDGGWRRSGLMRNNTFIKTGANAGYCFDMSSNGWDGIQHVNNNIFFVNPSTTWHYQVRSGTGYRRAPVRFNSYAAGGDYYGDYNLWYSAFSDSAMYNDPSSQSPPTFASGFYSIGSDGVPCVSSGMTPAAECNSTFGDPAMLGGNNSPALLSNYDTRLTSSSVALSGTFANSQRAGAPTGTYPTSFWWVAPDSGVAHVGHADSTGIDSTHAITLYQANRMAKPGDTFILMPGRYDLNRPHRYAVGGAGGAAISLYADDAQSVAPGRDGQHNTEGLADSSQAIRYVSLWYYKQAMRGFASAAIDTGLSATANGMPRVAGITIANKAIHVAGISADSIRVLSYVLPGSGNYVAYAEWDSLTYCKARTVNVISARNVTMRNCWVISPYVATASGAANARNSLSGAIEFKFLSGVWHTYLVQNQIGISIAGQSNGVQFTRSRLEGILTPAAQTPDTCAYIRMSRSVNLHVDTCTVKVNCFTAGETSPAGSVDSLTARAFDLRDDAQYVSMVSDTMNLGTRSGNLATVLIGTAGGPINNVVIQDCIISGDWALVPRIRSSAWSLLRSALGSKRGTPVYWGATAGTSTSASKSDSITISQCSFYADSLANGKSQPVLALLLDQSADLVQVNRNIFYRLKTTAASSTGDTCGAIVRYGNVAYSTGFSTDANLYFTPSDSSQNAVYCEGWTRTGYGPNCAARIDYGTNPAPPCIKDNIKTQTSAVLSTEGALALNTDEENSYWGTPSFIDASVDSAFDGRIYCSSVTSAYVPNWVGSFGDSAVGANQPQFNVTPSVCTALDTTAATAATLSISFTSGANDGATNRGSPAGYYVRYGTNPALSEGTYTTATVSPGSPGATITATLTSLSANTTYYFAVITVGRCGDQSPLSAIQCGVTRKSTGQSGGDICREN